MTVYESEQIICPYCYCTEFDNVWLVSRNQITAVCTCCGTTLSIAIDEEGSYVCNADLIL